MSFNYRLKQLRISNNLTQGDLADILGIKATTIANYESNRNEPSFNKLIMLANYFDVSCDYLLGQTEDCRTCSMKSIHRDHIEILDMFSKLNTISLEELKVYMDYLLYKQEHLKHSN